MTQTSEEKINLYTEMITRWLKLKKEGRLMSGDDEPNPATIGLDPWAAKQVKQRVEREIYRSC